MADNMSVADNMFMGAEILSGNRIFLNDKEMVRQAQKIIDEMEIDIDVRVKVGTLSIAKQQMVEISRSLLSNAKLIVMDEPTSSLTSTEIVQLFAQIDKPNGPELQIFIFLTGYLRFFGCLIQLPFYETAILSEPI